MASKKDAKDAKNAKKDTKEEKLIANESESNQVVSNNLDNAQKKELQSREQQELVILAADSEEQQSQRKISVLSEFCRMIWTFDGFVFFLNLFGFGIAMSFVENFLFLYLLDSLDAPAYLCGLTITVMVVGEVPVFAFSSYLISKFGIHGLLLISHIAYVVRVVGYSLLPEHNRNLSFLILILEPLHGLTYAGMWLASVEYSAHLVPNRLQGTMQGLMGGVYHGLADSVGALLGGWIYDQYGPQNLYRVSGVVIFVWMILFQVLIRIRPYCSNSVSSVNSVKSVNNINENKFISKKFGKGVDAEPLQLRLLEGEQMEQNQKNDDEDQLLVKA